MEKYILECCVDSVESAINAAKGGASRLELCSNLIIGGTTPDVALVKEIRKYTDIRIHALIRPRFGDFCYSHHEIEIMKNQILALKEAGVEGVVIGVLDEDGNLNVSTMKELIEAAKAEPVTETEKNSHKELSITLHRAFDMCKNPYEAMETAITLGIDTILTSGQKPSAWEGRELLRDLIEKAEGRIDIMAGAGVNASVIEKLIPKTKGISFHMSGKITLDSPMRYRKKEVSMGLPSLSEYEIWQTSEDVVREAAEVIRYNLGGLEHGMV